MVKDEDENENEDNKISRLLAEAEQSGISQLDAAGLAIILSAYVCIWLCVLCNVFSNNQIEVLASKFREEDHKEPETAC